MKQRFYVVIESKEQIDPKDVLFAICEARPSWGAMSASLAAQQSVQADLGKAQEGRDTGEGFGALGNRPAAKA